MGMGMLGLSLLSDRATSGNPFRPRSSHFIPKAKHVIHVFCNGGASQVDTFDPKPALQKYAGKEIPIHLKTERETGGAYPSPFSVKK